MTVTAEWVAAEDWTTYEARMLTGRALTHSLGEVQDRIRAFCAKHRKAELFARGIAGGATLAPVNTIADVLALDHLARASTTGRPYRLPDGRVLRAPGPFVVCRATPVAFSAAGSRCRRAQRRGPRIDRGGAPRVDPARVAGAQRGYAAV